MLVGWLLVLLYSKHGKTRWPVIRYLPLEGCLSLIHILNNVTTRTIEITCGQIYDYKVKYDEYIVLRQERRERCV